MITRRCLRLAPLLLLLGWLLSGCAELRYYGQAVAGQWRLLRQRRPVDELLTDPSTSTALQQHLETARRLRDFASTELALPDNGSYRSYADLQRSYVVLNVFAAPELSLQLREWCFPLVGCVNYRGYFNRDNAKGLADSLRAQGQDVYLGSVPAYSTLGWFDDPLLNTFIDWPTGQFAELIFHELAHQRLFIAGDTDFNESFATFVGRVGARRWLERYGKPEESQAYADYNRRHEQFMELLLTSRRQLERLYTSAASATAKRTGKRRLLTELYERYQALKQSWGGYSGYDAWFNDDLNNAKLGAINVYTRFVPAFETLFARSGGDFDAFYQAATAVGRLPPVRREACLRALLQGNACATGNTIASTGVPEPPVTGAPPGGGWLRGDTPGHPDAGNGGT
jgi:predicted aminopeptidase